MEDTSLVEDSSNKEEGVEDREIYVKLSATPVIRKGI